MASADILRAARARIEDPKNWTQGAYARDAQGRGTRGKAREAVCWCAYGALAASGGNELGSDGFLLESAAEELFDADVVDVNDKQGHAAVLQVFDAAIAAAEAEAGR